MYQSRYTSDHSQPTCLQQPLLLLTENENLNFPRHSTLSTFHTRNDNTAHTRKKTESAYLWRKQRKIKQKQKKPPTDSPLPAPHTPVHSHIPLSTPTYNHCPLPHIIHQRNPRWRFNSVQTQNQTHVDIYWRFIVQTQNPTHIDIY